MLTIFSYNPQIKFNIFKLTIVVVVIMLNSSLHILGDIPVPEKLIEIDNFQVLRNDTLKIGDTLTVLLDFKAKVNCDVAVALPVRGGLTLLGDTNTNFTYKQIISVERDSSNYISLNLVVSDTITSYITGAVSIVSENKYFNSPIGFISHDEVNKAIDIDAYNPYCQNFNNNYDKPCEELQFYKENLSLPFEGPRKHIVVSGNLLYNDYYAPNDVGTVAQKGSLANVWLFFYRMDEPTKLYHPVPFDDNDMPREGIHFFRTEQDGGFGFNFSYRLDSLIGTKPVTGWRVALFVGKENEALRLYSNTNHLSLSGINNPDRSSGIIKLFKRKLSPESTFSLDDPVFNWNLNNVFFTEISSIDREGAIFRHTTLSRKFLIERLDIDEEDVLSMVHNIPQQVEVVEEFHPTGYSYYNTGTQSIHIVSKSPERRIDPTSNLMAHEWGHYYYHYIRNFADFPTGSEQVVSEGWAVFFSDAMMNWAENKYGDRRSYKDDLEMGPYFSYYAKVTPTLDDHNVRFGNVEKINAKHDMARFACYLWNIYDSYEEGNFIRPEYEGYENDDVHGLGEHVFYCFKGYLATHSSPSTSEFNDYFKNYVASNDVELQNSIQRIYDFMRIGASGDLWDLYDNSNDIIGMIPPPVEIVESNVNLGTSSYVKVATTTYPDNIGIFAQEFDNDPDTYPNISYYAKFSNLEDGIFVEYFDFINNVWQYLGVVDTDPDPNVYKVELNRPQSTKYRLSTFKDIWDEDSESTIRYFSNNAHPEFTVTFKNNTNDDVLSEFSNLIYPNPSQDYLKIRSQVLGNKDISINIYNISGDKCFESKKSSYNNELYLTLPTILINGLYYIELIDTKTSSILIKDSFIINK